MGFKGKGLSLLFGANEVNDEALTVELKNEEADTGAVTFADLDNGTPLTWYFEIEALANYGSTSFWSYLWDNAGNTVAFVFKPYGNATATTAQPHFTGNATILAKPAIGGTANEDFTFEARLDVVGTPTKVTA